MWKSCEQTQATLSPGAELRWEQGHLDTFLKAVNGCELWIITCTLPLSNCGDVRGEEGAEGTLPKGCVPLRHKPKPAVILCLPQTPVHWNSVVVCHATFIVSQALLMFVCKWLSWARTPWKVFSYSLYNLFKGTWHFFLFWCDSFA